MHRFQRVIPIALAALCLLLVGLPNARGAVVLVDFYLPFPSGVTAPVAQGPGGSASHSNPFNFHAYDFVIPGADVVASAPGSVFIAVDNVAGQGGPANGNHVVLAHADGTCTVYLHLAPGSVQVAPGDNVTQAQQLGLQGNTGSTFPIGGGHHLHFARHTCDPALGIFSDSIPITFVETTFTSQNTQPSTAGMCDGMLPTIDMNTNGGIGTGTSGNDVILGTPLADAIDGAGGDDRICGGGGDDSIIGGTGNDRLFGNGGADVMRGNAGADMLDGGPGDDRLLGGIDSDMLFGRSGNDYLGGYGGNDTISGGSGNETIYGGFGADTIDGGVGNDSISGLIGNDTIDGGDGDDTLNGDRGNDTINGGAGNDVIQGGNANDVLNGGDGDDNISGGKADDQLSGGLGSNDTCIGNKQNTADSADTTCELIFGVP